MSRVFTDLQIYATDQVGRCASNLLRALNKGDYTHNEVTELEMALRYYGVAMNSSEVLEPTK